jgi:hypothetical protein
MKSTPRGVWRLQNEHQCRDVFVGPPEHVYWRSARTHARVTTRLCHGRTTSNTCSSFVCTTHGCARSRRLYRRSREWTLSLSETHSDGQMMVIWSERLRFPRRIIDRMEIRNDRPQNIWSLDQWMLCYVMLWMFAEVVRYSSWHSVGFTWGGGDPWGLNPPQITRLGCDILYFILYLLLYADIRLYAYK